jgi:hypothetical protein
MQRRWLRILLIILTWIVVGLIFSWQLRLLAILSGFQMTWTNIVCWELTRWCLWIFLFPLIIRMIRRSPQFPGDKKRFFITNSISSIVISLLHLAAFSIVYWFVMRFQEAFASDLPVFQILFVKLPEFMSKAKFDPHIVFTRIFSIDFHIGILIYWIILAGYQAIDYSRRAADLKSQLSRAQLDALKMQLHPHFLFNTLNSISALIHKNPEAADEMIGELGNFLRLTLQSNSAMDVTVEEELRFVSSYLEIERIRFQSKLKVEMLIDPETLNARVPNLILQPVIENAIRHGIAHCVDSGCIEIASHRNGRYIYLRVSNDGPWLSEDNHEGIGVNNVRERLKKMYNDDYQFNISNRAQGGVIVEMKIPVHTTPFKVSDT